MRQSLRKILLAVTLLVLVPFSVLGTITNVNLTNNNSIQNEPMVAINPLDHAKLVVGYNDFRTGSIRVAWSWSDNGGTVWTYAGSIVLTGYTYTADPVVAFDNAGTAYLAGLAYNYNAAGMGRDGSIFLAKSNDGGHTFTAFSKIVATGSGLTPSLDKPWLMINPANNHIYISWVRRQNAWDQTNEAATIWFTRSADGGLTFSAPIQVSAFNPSTGSNRSHGPQIALGPGNTIYLAWHTIEAGDPTQPGWSPPRIYIAESTDGGVTFGTNHQVVSFQFGRPNRFISMGTHPATGKIFITYADRPVAGADADVYIATATTASGSWNTQRVSDDPPGSGFSQFWPSLAVSANGRVDVLWYDQRNGPNKLDIYSTSSIDGGTTWTPNIRITPGYIPTSDLFYGDYNTVASVDDFSQLVWMDNRMGNQEIFTARVFQRPVDVMLVLDNSGSMLAPACPSCSPKLQVLKDAVEIFIKLWNSLAVAEPEHNLGVIYFKTNVTEFTSSGQVLLPIGPGTTNGDLLINDVKAQTTVPANLTAMGGGLQSAINQLTSSRPRRIVLFTDGMQNVNPMVVQAGAALTIDMSSAAYANSNISPTTPPTALNTQLERQISTIGVGSTPPFVTLLQNIAGSTGGKSYLTTAPDDNLRRFFVEQLVDALRGSSPQLIAYLYGTLAGGGAAETITVNRTASSFLVKVSWKRGAVPIEIKSIATEGNDVTGLAEVVRGDFYRIYTFRFPLDINGIEVGPGGKWTVLLSGKAGAQYEMAAIADEKRLACSFSVDRALSSTGNPLRLSARLTVDGSPVTTARTVMATVLRPGQGIGTALALARTPGQSQTTAAPALEPGASMAQRKFSTLIQQRDFWRSIQPLSSTVALLPQTDGSYSGSFTETNVPGTYMVIFKVEGEHPILGPYERTEIRTADVEFSQAKFELSAVSVVRREDVGDMTNVTIHVRPRDLFGNFLGPDYGGRILLDVTPGGPAPAFLDLLDGAYETTVSIPQGANPQIELSVMGDPLYRGALSALNARPPYSFALSAHTGRTVPLGTFANGVDADMLYELDAEYRFAPRYSVVGVLGRYQFKPDFNIMGGTIFLRRYQPVRGFADGYVEAGGGLYDPGPLNIALGLSAGFGFSRQMLPAFYLEVGVDFWHLFTSPNATNFLGVKLGIRIVP